jgi:hypothetical protein
MKNLNESESNNLDSIIINNIIWSNQECQNSSEKEIKFDFININNFQKEQCKNHEYYIIFFRDYVNRLQMEKDVDCTIDSFSFIVKDKNGLYYKSDETF